MKLKEIFAFVNNKGGVGKTTTVQTVAAGILRKEPGARVLCIDLDAQGSLSSQLGWLQHRKDYRPQEIAYTIATAIGEGLEGHLPVYKKSEGWYYVPACPQLSTIDNVLNAQMQPKKVLEYLFGAPVYDMSGCATLGLQPDGLTLIQDDFDYVLLDCPPALSVLTYNAITVASGVVIPVQLEGLAVEGLARIVVACEQVKKELNPDLEIRGMLLSMADERTNVTRDLDALLRERYSGMVFRTRVRRCVKMVEAQLRLKDIFEYAPDCTAARDYAAFIDELIGENNNQ